MKITAKLLRSKGACLEQVRRFRDIYLHGIDPSGEAAVIAAAEGFNVLWAIKLLSREGPGSRRAFALWCAEQVQHLTNDHRVSNCLDTIRTELFNPGTQNLVAANSIARSAICDASSIVAMAVADAAAWAAWSNKSSSWAGWASWVGWAAAKAAAVAATTPKGVSGYTIFWSPEVNNIAITARIAAREMQVFQFGEMLKEV